MTVLVTGGTGVVGTPVVQYLVESGREVRGLARSEASGALLADMGAVPARGDIGDPDSLERAVAGCDVVYHIAGRVSFCPQFPDRLYQVNVAGTRNVVRAARRAGGPQAGSHVVRGGIGREARHGRLRGHHSPRPLPEPLRPVQAPGRVGCVRRGG